MKYEITLNGKMYTVDVTETDAAITSVADAPVYSTAVAAPAAAPAPTSQPVQNVASGLKVASPMPGTILSVNVTENQAVKAGDVMFVLEAMKMENDIVAPADGTVKQILVSKGASVDTDDVLAVL